MNIQDRGTQKQEVSRKINLKNDTVNINEFK